MPSLGWWKSDLLERLSDLQLRDKKGHFESPGSWSSTHLKKMKFPTMMTQSFQEKHIKTSKITQKKGGDTRLATTQKRG